MREENPQTGSGPLGPSGNEQEQRAADALRRLIDAFDHVRFCRDCGENDARDCTEGGQSALEARAEAEAVLSSPDHSESPEAKKGPDHP